MIKEFIRIKEDKFISNEKPFIIKGFGLGSFLNIEHFMIKIPGIEQNIRKAFDEVYGKNNAKLFWNRFANSFFNEKDALFLKEIGINTIRLPFNYHHFIDDENDSLLKEDGFHSIDRILDLCEKNEIYVILDLHAAPGGQNPDWHSDNLTGESLFWHYEIFQHKVINLWEILAKNYKHRAVILGYDILNEPVIENRAISGKIVNNFYNKVISAIRKFDNNHIIFLEGDFYASDTTKFDIPSDPLIAYSIHFYPFFYVEKNIEQYKKMSKEERMNLLLLALKNTSLDDIKLRLKRPIWCGETGIPYRAKYLPLLENLLDETLQVFKNNNISWSIWTYKDAGSMGALYCKEDSLWGKLSSKLTKNWNFLEEFASSEEKAKEYILKLMPEYDNSELLRKVKFKLLSINDTILVERLKNELKRIPFDEIINYPDSFSIDNCEKWNNLISIIKKYL